MNVAYAVAVTLLDGTALAARFDGAERADIWELIERTTPITSRRSTSARGRLQHRLEMTLGEAASGARAFVEHPTGRLSCIRLQTARRCAKSSGR